MRGRQDFDVNHSLHNNLRFREFREFKKSQSMRLVGTSEAFPRQQRCARAKMTHFASVLHITGADLWAQSRRSEVVKSSKLKPMYEHVRCANYQSSCKYSRVSHCPTARSHFSRTSNTLFRTHSEAQLAFQNPKSLRELPGKSQN